MNIKQLLSDDEGVSPVIGVILMVAITVILAAVIAAFVLGLGDSDDVAPQTTFEFDLDEDQDELNVEATSGDTIDGNQLSLEGEGVTDGDDIFEDTEVTAGTSDSVNVDSDAEDETLNLVWESDDGDDSSILASFDVPDDADLS